jgi:hypothetical protein
MKTQHNTKKSSGGMLGASRRAFSSVPVAYRVLIAALVGLAQVGIAMVAVNSSL